MSTAIAFLALVVSLATFAVAGRRARIDRQRRMFADAFEAVMEYREFPFMVRRRNPNQREEERARLSGELSRVQARMNSHKARLLIEDPHIGKLYAELVKQTRYHAGAHIKSAWNNDPVAFDQDTHAPQYDFSALDEHDNDYLHAVADHVSSLPTRVARRWHGRRQRPEHALTEEAGQGDGEDKEPR
jgi:hypothetical protein